MNLAPGTVVDGRYTVTGLLGAGGMSRVYAAVDDRLGVEVALKVLAVPTAAIRERLVQEGRVQARLRHPNVVPVTDRVEVDGCPGLVMELVRGPSLEALLRTHRLDPVEAEHLFRGLLAGVAAAHADGLVHRDLKPGNVLLATADGALIPKVADFGLVKLLSGDSGASATRSGATLGTPRYMAPEQVRDAAQVDARADLWALGAVLFELLAGAPAFDGADSWALFANVVAGARAPMPDHVAPRLARVVDACLVVDREARAASCEALRELLDEGPVPPVRWRAETLAAARAPAIPALPQREAATWEPSSGPAPTWAPPPSVASSAPAVRWSPVLRWGSAAAGVAAAGWISWAASRGPAEPAFTVQHAGPVDDGPAVAAAVDAAWRALLANRDHEARTQIDLALAGEPTDPTAWLVASLTSLSELDVARWREEVRAGALLGEADPGDDAAPTLTWLDGELHRDASLGWWGPALAERVAQDPDDLVAWLLWLEGSAAQGPPPVEALTAFLDRHPTAVVGWNVLASASGEAGAAAVVDRALAANPSSAVLYTLRAESELAGGRFTEARSDTRRALQLDPGWYATWGTLAALAVRDRDPEGLREVDRAAERLPPAGRATAVNRLVWELVGQGRLDEADDRLGLDRLASLPPDAAVTSASLAVSSTLGPWFDDPDRRAAAVRRLEGVLARPEVDPSLRTLGADSLALARVADEGGELPANLSPGATLAGALHAADDPVLPTGCSGLLFAEEAQRAWVLAGLDDLDGARAALAGPPCPTVVPITAAVAAARARIAARAGDRAGAEAALDELLAAWPQADPLLPIRWTLAREVAPRVFPAGALHAWLDRREAPLVVAIAPHEPAGPSADAWTDVLVRRLADHPRARVVRLRATDPGAALAEARSGGFDALIAGAVGRVGDEQAVSLRRVDAATGDTVGVADTAGPENAVVAGLEGLLLLALTDDLAGRVRDDLESVVRARVGTLAACHEALLARVPGAEGNIVARWSIAPSGRVSDVVLTEDGLGDPATAACVRDLLAETLFPAGLDHEIAWTFRFGR